MITAQRPLVSIGIPVFNGEDFVRQALDALLAQTYDNLELIISDNASTDRTGEICQEYATRDPRIKYIRNPSNVGLYANYRRVVSLATGEYFMWAAVDDLKPSDAIEGCVNALSRNQRAVMAHGIVLVRAPGADDLVEFPNAVKALDKNAAARVRFFTRGIEHNAMLYGMYRLDSLKQANFGSHLGQDYLLCLQMCLLGEVEYIGVPLIIFRHRQTAPMPPMYLDAPLTLWNLLNASRLQRRKCWTVLIMGSYYLATRGNVSFAERLGAIAAHITTFCSLYRSRLAKEVVFQAFQPFAWLSALVWRLARQWSPTFWLTRKVKALYFASEDVASTGLRDVDNTMKLADEQSTGITVIQASRGWVSLKLREVWEYRELLYFLTWRDIKVRYKQTVLGAAWAIIQPFFTMVVFSLFFGRLAKVPSDGIPYPIFAYAALVPWTFFANGLSESSNSLVGSSSLIKKVYFPRLTVPISSVASGIVDFVLAFVVLLGMMMYYRVMPTWNIVWVPFLLLLALVTALGVGLWLSAMNVQFRDVRYVVPFLTQFWMFATPIAYPSTLLSQPWRTLYGINPLVGVVEGFRWALLGTDTAPGPILIVSSIASLVIIIGGAFYFRRMEKTFADVV